MKMSFAITYRTAPVSVEDEPMQYEALWLAPGKGWNIANDATGKPARFDTAHAAEARAGHALVHYLNTSGAMAAAPPSGSMIDPKKQFVFMAKHDNGNFEDRQLFGTAEAAEQWRQRLADELWSTQENLADVEKPEDPERLADVYFELCDWEDFTVDSMPVN